MKASKRIENIGCGELSRKLPTMRYQFIQFIKSAFLHLHRFCPFCAIFQFVQIIFLGKRRQKKAIWCLWRRRYFIRKSPSRHHKWSGELLCWNCTLFLEFLNFSFSSSGIPQNNSDQNVLSSTPDPDWFAYAANDISLFPHADRHDL